MWKLICTLCQIKTFVVLVLLINIAPNYDCQVRIPYEDDTTFLRLLQLGKSDCLLTHFSYNSNQKTKAQVTETITYLVHLLFLLPNVPRLSCGNVQPVPCRMLRGRDRYSFQFLLSFARRKAGSFSASLSRWLGSRGCFSD